MVEQVDINENEPERKIYIIKFLHRNIKLFIKNFLKNESKNLTQETIEDILFPEVLSLLHQGSNFLYEKLSRLHPKSMVRLAKHGFLPTNILNIK